MCGYFCLGFIDFLLKDKSLPDYRNFFSPNGYKNNDKITLIKNMEKLYCFFICRKYRKFEKLKISYLFGKTFVLSVICSKWKNEDEKVFEEKDSIEILAVLGLNESI